MNKNMENNCKVCQTPKASYKCPKCFIRYCSLACFKQHKADETEAKCAPPVPQEKRQEREQVDQYQIEIEEEVVVPSARLEKAAYSIKLKPYLSHSKLQKLIKSIDSSKNRQKSLWKQIEKDDSFREFVDLMLTEMGYLDDKGQFST